MSMKRQSGAAALLMAGIFAAGDAGAAVQKKVNVDLLNVRSGPGTGYRVLGTLRRGTLVTVASTAGSWSRITSPKSGYVYAAYLASVTRTVSVIAKAPRTNVFHLARNSYNGFLHLPASGYGWYSGAPSGNRWGVPRMVNGFILMGRHWANGYPGVKGKRIRSNAISRKYGGYFPPHATHRYGKNIDVSPIMDSGNGGIVYIYQGAYSRYYTSKLVRLERAVWYVHSILFNDTKIAGCRWYRGHNNHMHVTINY